MYSSYPDHAINLRGLDQRTICQWLEFRRPQVSPLHYDYQEHHYGPQHCRQQAYHLRFTPTVIHRSGYGHNHAQRPMWTIPLIYGTGRVPPDYSEGPRISRPTLYQTMPQTQDSVPWPSQSFLHSPSLNGSQKMGVFAKFRNRPNDLWRIKDKLSPFVSRSWQDFRMRCGSPMHMTSCPQEAHLLPDLYRSHIAVVAGECGVSSCQRPREPWSYPQNDRRRSGHADIHPTMPANPIHPFTPDEHRYLSDQARTAYEASSEVQPEWTEHRSAVRVETPAEHTSANHHYERTETPGSQQDQYEHTIEAITDESMESTGSICSFDYTQPQPFAETDFPTTNPWQQNFHTPTSEDDVSIGSDWSLLEEPDERSNFTPPSSPRLPHRSPLHRPFPRHRETLGHDFCHKQAELVCMLAEVLREKERLQLSRELLQRERRRLRSAQKRLRAFLSSSHRKLSALFSSHDYSTHDHPITELRHGKSRRGSSINLSPKIPSYDPQIWKQRLDAYNAAWSIFIQSSRDPSRTDKLSSPSPTSLPWPTPTLKSDYLLRLQNGQSEEITTRERVISFFLSAFGLEAVYDDHGHLHPSSSTNREFSIQTVHGRDPRDGVKDDFLNLRRQLATELKRWHPDRLRRVPGIVREAHDPEKKGEREEEEERLAREVLRAVMELRTVVERARTQGI